MPRLALVLWLVWGFMVGIVFLALLISIMNDTYDRIKDAEEMEVGSWPPWRLGCW